MRFLLGFVAVVFLGLSAAAQERGVWVQVEAQPTLSAAQDRARAYAGALPDVAGFSLGSGWYAIVLGPYAVADAQTVLRDLRRDRRIPADSFIADGGGFGQQFWPVGTGAANTPRPLPEAPDTPAAEPVAEPTPVTEAAPDPALPDETRAEALASEERLSRPEREQLQVALQWAGFYEGAIDGAYGRGTRGAMEAWQTANGHDATGVLTTAQRAELLAAYNAVLAGLDLQRMRDDAAGIEMLIPAGVVAFAAYDPPFARFDATGDIPAQVLLISQEGDLNRLFGLYEIMQTLAIVPPQGPRERGDASFTLEGQDAEIRSHSWATLEDGQIKGFTLVWPAGDDERFDRLLAEMKASFTRTAGVLDPALARPDESQAIDLVSGLAVRQPERVRAGFFIAGDGTVLTAAEAVAGCAEVTLDAGISATVAHVDDGLGIAVLRPADAVAPRAVAAFQTGVPRLRAEVAVAGYPYGTALTRPTLTFGTVADIRGLDGETTVKRLEIAAAAGDAGGPVFDNSGAVLGMLLPAPTAGARVLPPGLHYSVDAETLVAALAAQGITAATTDTMAFVPPEAITRTAADIAVRVNCW